MIRLIGDFLRKLHGPTWAERSAPLRSRLAQAKRRGDTRSVHQAQAELQRATTAELCRATGWRRGVR